LNLLSKRKEPGPKQPYLAKNIESERNPTYRKEFSQANSQKGKT
jgi:hypothetical protein